MSAAADQLRWEKEVEEYEKSHPHYRSHLAQKHVKKLNEKGVIDVQLAQLGIRKPFTARHYYIKEQVEVHSCTLCDLAQLVGTCTFLRHAHS